jgi:hypothetical protein
MRGFVIWAVTTLAGVAVMLLVELLLHGQPRGESVPVAQAIGLWSAWVVAWPLWFRHQPNRRLNFTMHVAWMGALCALVAGARILFKIG